jgi:dephospho-CoA kinase
LDIDRHYRWDSIVATWCPEEIQIQRVMERDGVERSDALMRIERQLPAEDKADMADFAIDTSEPLEQVKAQVQDIYERLLAVG